MPSISPYNPDVGQLDSSSFLADTCVIHDLILNTLKINVAQSGNYPFQGHDVWDLHFYRKALMSLPRAVTTSVHVATARPDFTAPAVEGLVASVVVHGAPGFNNRLKDFEKARTRNRLVSLLPPHGLAERDSVILDNFIHFTPDPLASLTLLRNALPRGARVLLALPMALDQTMDLYGQLGYVFLSESEIQSLSEDLISVNIFKSGYISNEWPQYSKVGIIIERFLSC